MTSVQSNKSLSGKTALVTGAGQRIGRSIALALAEAGADVVVHYHRSPTQARAVAGEIRALGVRAIVVQADLSRPREAARIFEKAGKRKFPIDILVNNASEYRPGKIRNLTEKDFAHSTNLHALSPLMLSQAMARSRRAGCIINILDARNAAFDPYHAAYQLGKNLLASLTNMMAQEMAPGIRVNAVAPGYVLPAPGTGEHYKELCRKANPLQRMGSPEEVARAVLFLVSMPFVTGQTIYVDGGYHLRNHSSTE